MKFKSKFIRKFCIYIFLFFLLSSISTNNSFKSKYDKLKRELRKMLEDNHKFSPFGAYFKLLSEDSQAFDKNCSDELFHEIGDNSSEKYIENVNKTYPWILDYFGKALNDLGDEIECIKSLKNTTFLICELYTYAFIYDYDLNMIDFLGIKNFTIGVCLINSCTELFKNYFNRIINLIDYIYNKTKILDENMNKTKFYDEEPDLNNISYILIVCSIFYIILKLIIGLFRLMLYPKGYAKYAFQLLQEKNKFDNSDTEENKAFFPNNQNNDLLLNEEVDNSKNLYLDSYLPKKIRVLKFFDFFNDFTLLTTKRNRYYNDNGLETILFMKVIAILFLIFYGTFITLVSLPSKDIFNREFFKSSYTCIFKMSINSLTCLIMLEGAYTTNKLVNYIKAQILESYLITKKKPKIEIQLLIVYGKFIIFFIPKIFLFYIIYYVFYYNVEGFKSFHQANKTFHYLIHNIVKEDKECGVNPFSIFNINIFSTNIDDFNKCYEFTFIYFNIFLSTLFFMIIIYLSFLFRNKIFEIFIILINFVLFFLSQLLIKDKNNDEIRNKKPNYRYYHFIGQSYSTKVFYSLLGFYHLGYILGFMIFHFENNKDKYKYKSKKIKNELSENISNIKNDNDTENNKLNEEINIDDTNNKINNNTHDTNGINKKMIINYYPLSFLNNFLFWLNDLKLITKNIIIIICLILLVGLSFIFYLYVAITDSDFNINLSIILKLYFLYEKHLFIIFFFIINLILITYPKKGNYKFIINSRTVIGIGRTGFTIICSYYFMNYLGLCNFYIKVNFNIPTFFLISIGNFLMLSILCFIFNIILELPMRMAIKKLLRKNIKKK